MIMQIHTTISTKCHTYMGDILCLSSSELVFIYFMNPDLRFVATLSLALGLWI